jgi:hypothetical protein
VNSVIFILLKDVTRAGETKNMTDGKLFIYGCDEGKWLIKPVAKIYIDSEFVGKVEFKGLLELDIKKDCMITVKIGLESDSFPTKVGEIRKIRLDFRKRSGLTIYDASEQ